jgi:predicted Zn-dependent protease
MPGTFSTTVRLSALGVVAIVAAACRTPQDRAQEELARDVVERVRAERTLVADEAVLEYVRGTARPLVAAAGRQKVRFRFFVLEDAQDTSSSARGGAVFVNTGALEAAPGTGQVAAMLAHEIAHVVLGHEVYDLERDRGAAHREGSKEARGMRALGSSREDVMRWILAHRQWTLEQELAADREAVRLLVATGGCPEALAALLRRRADDARAAAPGAKPSRTAQRLDALAPEVERAGACPSAPAPDPLDAVKVRILHGSGR